MLYKIEVENFYSIKDRQILDLSIDSNVIDDENRYSPIFQGSEKRAPKVVAIFGANASGKTTLLRVLEFIVSMVVRSVSDASGMWAMPFNDQQSANTPMKLALEFGGFVGDPVPLLHDQSDEKIKEQQGLFRYELEIEVSDGVPKQILVEALRKRPHGKGKWQRVFERDSKSNVKGSDIFSLSGFGHLTKTLAPNHSVLSSFAKFNHPAAKHYVEMVSRVLFVMDSLHSTPERSIVDLFSQQSGQFDNLRREIGRMDVGIEDVRLLETKDGPQLSFKHRGLHQEMGLPFESKGTRTFIKVLPIIHYVLESGSMAAIDEIDDSIHPNLLPEITRWFYNISRNPDSAQLFFTSHAVSLLEHLKKEEIVICEKNSDGRTKMFSLMEVKSLRRDDNHYRKYVDGIYGGVPLIG